MVTQQARQQTGGAEGAEGVGGAGRTGGAEGVGEAEGAGPEEAERRAMRRLSDPASLEDNRSLLEELGRIEAELQESLRLDMERQQEAEFLRQHEKKLLWQNLCYLSLNQRVAKYTHTHTHSKLIKSAKMFQAHFSFTPGKCILPAIVLHRPWVSSYFRKFPMHIYCLPVQAANHRGRRRGLKKKP
ncbi:hypothetical protein PAMP_015298 [Pampus punctatissimus]